MGFIVLGVAILPYLGVGGMQLFRLEAPGAHHRPAAPAHPRDGEAALGGLRGLTGVLAVLYLLGGMTLFDAVNHALTTMPTGGFSTRNASMAAFSPYIQWVTIVFMFLAGTSFTLHYRVLGRGPGVLARPEWRLYTGIILVGHAAGRVSDPRPAASRWSSCCATRPSRWWRSSPPPATAPPTSRSGRRARRSALPALLPRRDGRLHRRRDEDDPRAAGAEARLARDPQAAAPARGARAQGGRQAVQEHVMLNVLGFVLIYMMLFGARHAPMAALGLSLPAAAGAAATAISNVGPGLAELGPVENFGGPWQGHLILTFLMLVGPLEIYTVLLLFHPGLWRARP
jgi:trk system potassium uptake protein